MRSNPAAAVPSTVSAERNETLGTVLSPSQANLFLSCSARWWFKYGAGLPDPKSGSLCRGTAVDKTVERWFRLILEDGTPEIEAMASVYEESWNAAAEETVFRDDEDPAELKRQGAIVTRKYLDEVAPEIRPARIQERVCGEIGGVRVVGFVDIVDVDGRIIDVKTATRRPGGLDPGYLFQIATYRQLLPGANGKARIDSLVATKTPRLVTIEHEMTAADERLTQRLYPLVREGITEGLYFPNRASSMCSRRYCAFAEACVKEFGGYVD